MFPVCQDFRLCLICKCDLNYVTLHNKFLERKCFLAKHVIIPLTLKVIYFKNYQSYHFVCKFELMTIRNRLRPNLREVQKCKQTINSRTSMQGFFSGFSLGSVFAEKIEFVLNKCS
jgi:hypothetical protein